MESQKDIKIFVSHRIDLDSFSVDNDIFYPVRCGAIFDKRTDVDIPGDNTGDNISEKRESFCELTVMYWAWKNMRADYYGLCHYRRYMNFGMEKKKEDKFGNICYKYLDNESAQKNNLNNTNEIRTLLQNIDYAYTTFDVSDDGFKNVYEQYSVLPTLHKKDLDLALNILNEMYPEYIESAKKYLNGSIFYPCLMFIMRKDIFDEFCKWLFSILFKLEKEIDITDYSLEEKRGIGHIAERLFGIYITHLMNNKALRHKKFQRVLFLNTHFEGVLKPYFSQNNIPIAMASSDFFVPYLSITLESLLENSSTEYNYDLIILNTGITDRMKHLLKSALSKYPNVHVRFFDVTAYLRKIHLSNQMHFTIETYYRLLAPKLFHFYEKILYIDSDLIICQDISKLFCLDIGDHLIGASIDPDFCGEYNYGNPSIKKYCDEELKLDNPYRYFQAGVLLFNIKELNKNFSEYELIEFANNKKYIYADQDILNVQCQGKVFYFDMEWNVLNDCAGVRVKQFIMKAPCRIYKRYLEARKKPRIIHYAGFEKPWTNTGCDFSEFFWKYARKSIFYEIILQKMTVSTINYCNQTKLSLARRVTDKYFPKNSKRRSTLKKIIPRDSMQWKILKKLYHKIALD